MSPAATRSPWGGSRAAVSGAVTTPRPAAESAPAPPRPRLVSSLCWHLVLASRSRSAPRFGNCDLALPVRDCSIRKRRPGQDNGTGEMRVPRPSPATRMKPKTSSFSALAKAAAERKPGPEDISGSDRARLAYYQSPLRRRPVELPSDSRARAAPLRAPWAASKSSRSRRAELGLPIRCERHHEAHGDPREARLDIMRRDGVRGQRQDLPSGPGRPIFTFLWR